MITLTLRSSLAPLPTQLDLLRQSFRRLRQTLLWRQTQRGGFAIIEVTWNPKLGCWHPHLHVLSEGSFINQRELSKGWKGSSRGSFIVDVRAVKSGTGTAEYLSSYLSKSDFLEAIADDERWVEYFQAVTDGRQCLTFGTARKTKPPPPPKQPLDGKSIGRLGWLMTLAARGDGFAKSVLDLLYTRHDPNPYLSAILDRAIEDRAITFSRLLTAASEHPP